MYSSAASVPTRSGLKYLTQLCKHWAHKLPVELSEGRGIVRFPSASAEMQASSEDLTVRIEAEDLETLERYKGVVATHLDRFAFREAPLPFSWS
jgi:hypothetical protein